MQHKSCDGLKHFLFAFTVKEFILPESLHTERGVIKSARSSHICCVSTNMHTVKPTGEKAKKK